MSSNTWLPNKSKRFLKTLSAIALFILSIPCFLLKLLCQWIKRLPARFSYTTIGIAVIYFFVATLLSAIIVGWVTVILPEGGLLALALRTTIIFFFMLVLFLATLIFALVLLGVPDRLLWPNPMLQKFKIHEPVFPKSGMMAKNEDDPLQAYKKIGIILSGGGAKGAYQAGALKAIYEFLEEHNAHDKVKMIAATSIGSWNALFWLAGLIKPPDKQDVGLLEQWWSQINVQNIIRPKGFFPMRQNHLLSNKPWQVTFDAFFGQGNPKASDQLLKSKINFYFTRSNVGAGRLEFATNRRGPSVRANDRALVIEDNDLEGICKAVFCSMDIPPLFEYTREERKKKESEDTEEFFFEDGGVINNLPILFGTEYEECDLLFILPLNASFAQEVDHHSLTKRLFRVMDVRQGILERNSFKMINLYNELAGLRKKYEREIDRPVDMTAKLDFDAEESSALRALNRTHEVVRVFAICPAPELTINTTEFWKTEEARQAFQLMHKATKAQLEKFKGWVEKDRVQLALVRSDGEVEALPDSKRQSLQK